MTKSGSYIYWGDAAHFHEWVFRTELRARAAGTDESITAFNVLGRAIDSKTSMEEGTIEAFVTVN